MLHQIKAQQFYTDLRIYQQLMCLVQQKIEKFKDFPRLFVDFPVLVKADLIFKDFSRNPSKFKNFLSLHEPCSTCMCNNIYVLKFRYWIFVEAESVVPHWFDAYGPAHYCTYQIISVTLSTYMHSYLVGTG